MINRRHVIAASAGVVIPALTASSSALAQQDKLTRLIVGFPPGGGTDVAARSLADKLRGSYPAGVIVENRPGAAGRLAVEYVKTSPADGATMLFTTDFAMTIYPHSFRKLSYDPIKDFTPVAVCAKTSLAFIVGPTVPETVKTPADFVAWCKANPKQAAYASTSAGATPHFAGLMFSKAAGIPILHVPYKGGAPALQDLMGGQIASSFNPVGEVLPQLKSGKLRVLATTGAQRNKFMPDVPTMVESGFKDVVAEVWLGVLMPANTPPAIVAKAATAINDALKSQELKDTYSKFGMDAMQGTPQSFAALIRDDLAAWGPVIKASGFTAEE
ncbi:MAG: Bug family tripartite tricarboxylate transporter substrate binding protein [Pseudomonadota bacterium]